MSTHVAPSDDRVDTIHVYSTTRRTFFAYTVRHKTACLPHHSQQRNKTPLLSSGGVNGVCCVVKVLA